MHNNGFERTEGNFLVDIKDQYFCDDCSKRLNEKTYLKNGGLCFDCLENED